MLPTSRTRTERLRKLLGFIMQRTKSKKTYNIFHQVVKNEIRTLNIYSKYIIVAADKTRNMHKMSHEKYDKLVNNGITQNYRRAEDNISNTIATECRNLSRKRKIENHLRSTMPNLAFITIKNNKDNFTSNTKFRLINPTNREISTVQAE